MYCCKQLHLGSIAGNDDPTNRVGCTVLTDDSGAQRGASEPWTTSRPTCPAAPCPLSAIGTEAAIKCCPCLSAGSMIPSEPLAAELRRLPSRYVSAVLSSAPSFLPPSSRPSLSPRLRTPSLLSLSSRPGRPLTTVTWTLVVVETLAVVPPTSATVATALLFFLAGDPAKPPLAVVLPTRLLPLFLVLLEVLLVVGRALPVLERYALVLLPRLERRPAPCDSERDAK